MFKRQLLVTVSTLALTGAATAADLPVRMPVKAMPAPAIVQLWAGPYIGINGGAVWHRTTVDTTIFPGNPYDSAKLTATGGTIGGTIGYNWQSQNFVFGLEADGNWVGAKETKRQFSLSPALVEHTSKLEWLATVRARAGMAFGPTLMFITGGLAVGGVNNSWTFSPACCGVVSNDGTRFGWTAGGGIEHFVSQRVTVKAEVLYVDLGRETATNPTMAAGYTSRFRNTAVVGRLGVNLKW
jgi:outer membrane immunogenic protein